MLTKQRYSLPRIAGIVFGLVLPLPFALLYSVILGILCMNLFKGEGDLGLTIFVVIALLWSIAGWVGLASLFSILVRSDYSSRPIDLRQISGLVIGIVAASPWIIIAIVDMASEEFGDLFYGLILLCLGGPITVAVFCLTRLKWRIREPKQGADLAEGR